MQSTQLKKARLEPYIHLTVKEVFDMFGKVEAFKKAIFGDFWDNADQFKDYDTLLNEFNQYANQKMIENSIIIPITIN